MRQQLTSSGHSRLLMLFSGWASDASWFQDLKPEGYDLMVLWDYRSLALDLTQIIGYKEIIVMGWSFGVPAAATFLNDHPSLPVTARIAVNGTLFPCDDQRGIPQNIFLGTLTGLNERNLAKFCRRMAGPNSTREIAELQDELSAINERETVTTTFDTAYIGSNDRIIPPQNQRTCFERFAARIVETQDAHWPDFKAILRRVLINKSLVASRFAKASHTYTHSAWVQRHVAHKLMDLWQPTPNHNILEVGCGNGLSTQEIIRLARPKSLTLMDLAISEQLPTEAVKIQGDAETLIGEMAAESFDAVVSASAMQWFNSAAAFMRRAVKVLKSGGKLVIATYGNETYKELRQICHIEKRYPDAEHLLQMIPTGSRLETMVTERIPVKFATGLKLLRHVRDTGVNSLSSGMSPIESARRVVRNYPGECILMYEPIYLIIKKL